MSAMLHTIAAALWLFALLMAAAVGLALGEKDMSQAKFGIAVMVLFAAIAFTLQVLA